MYMPVQTRNILELSIELNFYGNLLIEFFKQIIKLSLVEINIPQYIHLIIINFNFYNMYSNIQRVEMSISFDKLSSKQLLCQCLDLAAAAFRELLKFINKQPTQIGNNSIYDFNKIISYVLQPQIFERISQSVGIKENNDKYYLKNLIFELRSLRNIWAHSTNIEYRMVHRAFDSVELLLSKLNVDKSSNIYVKVDSYRRLLIVKMAQQYLKQQSQQKNGYMTQQNRY